MDQKTQETVRRTGRPLTDLFDMFFVPHFSLEARDDIYSGSRGQLLALNFVPHGLNGMGVGPNEDNTLCIPGGSSDVEGFTTKVGRDHDSEERG